MKKILILYIFSIFLSCSTEKIISKEEKSCQEKLFAYNKLVNYFYINERNLKNEVVKKNIELINFKDIKKRLDTTHDYLKICKKSLIDEKIKLSSCKDNIVFLKKHVDIEK